MAITDDLRKTLTDPTPLYFAAGTADLAVEQARKVPALIEQLRAEAPERIEAVRNTDPKAVQEKVTSQAKEAQATMQAKVTEVIGSFDSDLRKLGENAQDLALRSLGVAAEYAVRARETYEKVAERGEQTVKNWRGETAEEIVEIAVVVEPRKESKPTGTARTQSAAKPGPAKAAPAPKPAPRATKPESKAPAAPAKKAPARKPVAKKTPPSAK
ncbi:hypothetical protein OG298_19380 [Streptomyces sp. NBC_01005]|uniref:hypothetical protein n=1 Tax=unclassified Streptomyces TaxID=2593676 RepID=UPI00225680C9|nr:MULTISPECIES: hypothetical protein [unclassified Streptomyces]WSW06370.1 hypothetical protein OG298_19380 [Streptomyces sp. NBC_01005]WTB55789.1 hypothetical protein OG832_22855 [Streptomyces sp. NBC_00826]WTC95874.1 hypothetical protein OH736_19395 [Streptomyces sp. NBC_01650]WTH91328.1 hypothetical protein OIC43_20840 [Streptomyces sp. NBC_00825]WTI00056.1 hypothetical protein OHA23_20825 [Streptomyces sp. NBC_00822]